MSRVHAKLSPSSAERWFNCAGVINLINRCIAEGRPLRGSGKAAAEGTVAHGLAEDFVQGKVDLLTLTSRVGETVMQEGFEIEITDAMIEGVIEYADHVIAVKRAMKHKPAGIVGEAEVTLAASSVDPEVYGFTDYLLYQKGDQLHVMDFKFGKGVVPAEENKQGLVYVLGAVDLLKSVFDKVVFHIIQPRRMDGGESVDTWELPKGRIEAFREELRAAIKRTRDPKAPLTAGAWCKFCPVEAHCPEKGASLERAVQTTFTRIPAAPSKEVALAMIFPPVALLSAEQVARILDHEDGLDSFLEAVRERARAELLKDSNSIPGYKLVEGKTNRAWSAEGEVESAFAMLGDERYNRKLKSPAQMEKIAGKEEVAKLTYKPAGKLTVAKSADKRQGLGSAAGDAAAVFGVLETTAVKVDEENIFGDLGGPAKKERNDVADLKVGDGPLDGESLVLGVGPWQARRRDDRHK